MGGRSGANVHGRDALVPAVLAIVLGVASAGLGLAFRPEGDTRPLGLFLAGGGMAVVVGVVFLVHAIGGMREERRRRRALEGRPDEPWNADAPWARDRVHDETRRELVRGFGGTAAMAAFLGLFAYLLTLVGDEERGAALGGWIVLAVLSAFMVAGAGRGLHLLLRRGKHGPVELKLARVPFHLGERLEAELVRAAGGPSLGSVFATLRCVQERYTARRENNVPIETQVLHEERVALGPGGGRLRFPIAFDLPADPALATDLTTKPPRYWELEVTSDVPGIDFGATFVVPVYGRDTRRS
jgi:hypothetical protein